jgi:hypothetical protein
MFSCGCKYRTPNQADAVEHILESGHAITAAGMMRPAEYGLSESDVEKLRRTWNKQVTIRSTRGSGE